MQLALVNRRKVPSRGIRELMDLAPRPSQRPGPAGEPGQLSSVRRAGGGAGCSPNTSQRQRGAGKLPDRGGRPAPALQTTWVSNPRSTPPRPLSLKQAPLETESSVGAPVDRSLPRCPPPTLRTRRRRGGRQTCRARTHRASDGRALRLPAFQHIKEGSPEEIEETGHK